MNWFLLGLPLATFWLNWFTFRRPQPQLPSELRPAENGLLSVLIPARNEETHLRELLAQSESCMPEAHEIVVYDDQSTDSTADVVKEFATQDARIRLVSGVSLPVGWVGKAHALERLREAAQGEHLVFLDADVRLEAGALSALTELLVPEGKAPGALSFLRSRPEAHLVTGVPFQKMETWFERAILPWLILTYYFWLPLRIVELPIGRTLVAANGQVMAVKAGALASLGGFSAIRNELVDDVTLAKKMKAAGFRVAFVDASEIASCRMYQSTQQVMDGFSKNIFEGLGSVPVFAFTLLLHLVVHVLPFLGLIASLIRGDGDAALSFGLLVGGLYLARIALSLRYRHPLRWACAHPITCCMVLAIAWRSFRLTQKNQLSWAGRTYPKRAERIA